MGVHPLEPAGAAAADPGVTLVSLDRVWGLPPLGLHVHTGPGVGASPSRRLLFSDNTSLVLSGGRGVSDAVSPTTTGPTTLPGAGPASHLRHGVTLKDLPLVLRTWLRTLRALPILLCVCVGCVPPLLVWLGLLGVVGGSLLVGLLVALAWGLVVGAVVGGLCVKPLRAYEHQTVARYAYRQRLQALRAAAAGSGDTSSDARLGALEAGGSGGGGDADPAQALLGDLLASLPLDSGPQRQGQGQPQPSSRSSSPGLVQGGAAPGRAPPGPSGPRGHPYPHHSHHGHHGPGTPPRSLASSLRLGGPSAEPNTAPTLDPEYFLVRSTGVSLADVASALAAGGVAGQRSPGIALSPSRRRVESLDGGGSGGAPTPGAVTPGNHTPGMRTPGGGTSGGCWWCLGAPAVML